MPHRYGKQDARNAILDLSHYDADDMLVWISAPHVSNLTDCAIQADLGEHRHANLPLAGRVVYAEAQPPTLRNLVRKWPKLRQRTRIS